MDNKVKKAVILLNRLNNDNNSYLKGNEKIAGEPILRRAVLACQGYGIDTFYFIYSRDDKDLWKDQLNEKRIASSLTWIESDGNLGNDFKKIYEIESDKSQNIIIFEIDTLIHPSLLNNIINLSDDSAYIPVWGNSYENKGVLESQTKPLPVDKYILKYKDQLNKITIDESINNSSVTGVFNSKIINFGKNKSNFNLFSLDILISSIEKINIFNKFDSFQSLIKRMTEKGLIKIFIIKEGIWSKLKDKKSLSEAQKLLFTTVTKKTSGPVSRNINSRISKPITTILLKLRFSPNASTFITVIIAFISCYYILLDGYFNLVLAGFLWQMAAAVDRCDGELARIRHYVTKFGGWLDTITDNIEYAVMFFCFIISMYLSNESLLQNKSYYLIIGFSVFIFLSIGVIYLYMYMRKEGMSSQQTFTHNYDDIAQERGGIAKVLNFLKPLSKRDMWSLIFFFLCLANLKEFIYWVFMIACVFISIGILIGVKGSDQKRSNSST